MCTAKATFTKLILVICFSIFCLVPQSVHAGWDDKSDELPGFGTTNTILLLAAGTAAAFVVYKLATRGGDEPVQQQVVTDSTFSLLDRDYPILNKYSNRSKLRTGSGDMRILPVFAISPASGVSAFDNRPFRPQLQLGMLLVF